ncbi:hypothetical protein ACFZCP_22650 [Streptomyces sp. NPDC007971]|uniref:hypothetical protein n=1 Tax=Streptomyces sp. NPDC007971 TaxID=3364799 RepID=UPI0036F134EF
MAAAVLAVAALITAANAVPARAADAPSDRPSVQHAAYTQHAAYAQHAAYTQHTAYVRHARP